MSDTSNQNSNRRILVLGPSGQVGWELRRSLQSLGEVIVVGRTSGALEQPTWARQQKLSIDLAKPDSIRKVVRAVNPHVIVNAAAYTAVDKAEEQSELAMAINGTAPGILAEEAHRLDCGLIHYSTDYVFDGSGERSWREEDPTSPINVYGRTKLAGEEAIRTIGAGHLILRVCWVHGVHGANFVKTMLRLAAHRPELSIVSDQFGSPTSARVIADATAHILAQLPVQVSHELKSMGGTFHLACQGETNWCEYAQEIFRQARERGLSLEVKQVKPIPTSAYPVPAKRPLNSRMNCQKLAERFQIRPPHWKIALGHVLEEFIRLSPIDQELAGRSPLLTPLSEDHAA